MEITVKQASPTSIKSACLVTVVHEKRKLAPTAAALNDASNDYLGRILKSGDLGKGKTLLLHNVPNVAADRVLLVAGGKAGADTLADTKKALQTAVTALSDSGASNAAFFLDDWLIEKEDAQHAARHIGETLTAASYRFTELKNDSGTGNELKRATLVAKDRRQMTAAQAGARIGHAIGLGVNFARDLGNRPANVCTPTHLAEQARELKKGRGKLRVEVIEEKRMRELGMGSLLSVASGSRQPAKLIVLEYRGGSTKQKPVVLVGKGVTFDTGGISLKPAATMDEMKFDMCGAASVFGTLRACLEIDLPVNVVGLVPATENMPGGSATRPGDVVTSMSGQTIEILNTDAEGRLILADALSYAARFNPHVVIDIATLTGACVIALGEHASGLMSNDQKLADRLLAAGTAAGDRCWQLPLWDDYQEQLKTNFADMANIGGRSAGTITAACFLSRFAKDYKWAHLDIAGTAWLGGTKKGATGRPVPLLMQYLLDHKR
ncbi:MAG: leucyl aminopeptidase [Gammaproteobacteria bacterium]|nr:leucyl aminopeptidase [Gammaproteobacteria bacterium]